MVRSPSAGVGRYRGGRGSAAWSTSADDNSDVMLLTPKLFVVHALEGLQFTGLEQDILRDIWQGTKQPKEEPVA